jgi:phenazine biosynthesis protein phzE
VIRTADVSPDGAMRVTAGATLVRDSQPDYEVAETLAKAGGILSAFGLVPGATGTPAAISDLTQDEDVLIALSSRNQRLAKFWLTDQSGASPAPSLAGKKVAILHGEDDFVNMLAHVFSVLGMRSYVVRHEDYRPGSFEGADLVVVGPGPGDPREHDHPKIAAYRRAVDDLLAHRTPFLAVCLGHQVLCDKLGIPLAYKDIVFQGTQSSVGIDGREEKVGFYNTFVARAEGIGGRAEGIVGRAESRPLSDGVTVEADADTGDIHLVSGPTYRGVQFHAESILTENGFALLRGLLLELVG